MPKRSSTGKLEACSAGAISEDSSSTSTIPEDLRPSRAERPASPARQPVTCCTSSATSALLSVKTSEAMGTTSGRRPSEPSVGSSDTTVSTPAEVGRWRSVPATLACLALAPPPGTCGSGRDAPPRTEGTAGCLHSASCPQSRESKRSSWHENSRRCASTEACNAASPARPEFSVAGCSLWAVSGASSEEAVPVSAGREHAPAAVVPAPWFLLHALRSALSIPVSDASKSWFSSLSRAVIRESNRSIRHDTASSCAMSRASISSTLHVTSVAFA
mmetsp:Transcript_84494/g.273622  ORF Transcript_84494/g.273622 Transcript_84494/m.273622 type:complete len:274 (+) Transcript_84494:371-1192(+)